MNIVVTAGLSDYKFKTTIAPIAEIEEVENIYLVRREPIEHKKVINYNPPEVIRKFLYLAEIWRLCTLFYLCLFKKVDWLIGIHYRYHCVFVAIAGWVFKKPYIFSIVEEPMKYDKENRFFKLAQKAAAIGVRGSKSKKYLEERCAIEKDNIFVLPDYFAFKEELKSRVSCERSKEFVYVGGFVIAKRIDILIEIFAAIKNEGVDFDAQVIGTGPLFEQMKSLLKEKRLESHVKLLGYVEEIDPFFCDAKIMILSSDTEGLPTVLMEAMSCGVVCVVPDVGDITDLATDGYNALVVEALNIEQYKQAAIKLLNDEKLWRELSDNALKIHEERKKEYSLNNVASVWKKALRIKQ